MGGMVKKFGFLGLALCLAACGPAANQIARDRAREERTNQVLAEALVKEGHYSAFKKAFALYRSLYARPSLRPKVAAGYVGAGLLLALRERHLGVDNPATLAEVNGVIGKERSLAAFAAPAFMLSAVPVETPGVMKDISASLWSEDTLNLLRTAEDDLRSRALSDEIGAAVLVAWSCAGGRYSPGYRDPAGILAAHRDSLLLLYEAALCGGVNAAFFEGLLKEDPAFSEADYHLGQAALGEKRLFDAESHLLRAFEAIPESAQPPILLAGIYFATEEFETSLRFYDLVLEIAPEYRDAFLGRAIALAYLGRHDESMGALNRILELGFWLVGESHYWLAWNLSAARRAGEALGHIDEAKSRLPTNTHVFSLAGKIAAELGSAEKAEKDFREAVSLDQGNTDALFGLGALLSRQSRWPEAGEFYEKASAAYDAEAAAIGAAIKDLEKATISPDRKARLLQRRSAQLERSRIESATSAYNAAAAYINAGMPGKARDAAAKAADHPVFKDRVQALLLSIK